MNTFESATELMKEQFGHDVIISLATCAEDGISVRSVDGYYKDGAIYVLTHMFTQKMKDISRNPSVAICKDLMCAKGIGENLGNPKAEQNTILTKELREVFVAFYDRHVNEDDPGTCILKITLTSAVAFNATTKYVIDYKNRAATETPFINDIIYP